MNNKHRYKITMGIALFSAGVAIKNYALIGFGCTWAILGIINKFKNKKENK